MRTEQFGWKFTFVFAISLGLSFFLSLTALLSFEANPWIPVGAFAFGTFVLAGPVRWTLRERLSDLQFTYLRYTATVALLVSVGILAFSSARWMDTDWMFPPEAVFVGSILGYGGVVLVEYAGVPDRVRRAGL